VNAPKCGTGTGEYFEATKSCTYVSLDYLYVKIIDSTCKVPNPSTVFLANPQKFVCSSSSQDQIHTTIVADGTCQTYPITHRASLGSGNTIDFKIYTDSICNETKIDTAWTGISTTGACVNAATPNLYKSLAVTVPAPYSISSIVAAAAITAIVGGVIGSIVCCCVCWGALHACGVVNCPCFNRCCDRRKNIASSNSNSFPSTAYATQAPRSSPYGNARL
jgi:hypothetical protein